MNLFLLPQWLCIGTWRFFKLFTESLRLFPCRFSSIPRFVLVTLLSIFALLISYLHLCVVFIEHVVFTLFAPPKPYPIIFIVGPPRSGTTRMHKLLAADFKMFSSMKMWELLFAPATSQKLLLEDFSLPLHGIRTQLIQRFNRKRALLIIGIHKPVPDNARRVARIVTKHIAFLHIRSKSIVILRLIGIRICIICSIIIDASVITTHRCHREK